MLALHVPPGQTTATERCENTRSKRPRLSLQIASAVASQNFVRSAHGGAISDDMSSPTVQNTYNNSTKFLSHPSTAEAWTFSAKCTPSSHPLALPYSLPRGLQGILRNTLLPPRQRSATSLRTPRRIFNHVKSVSFRTPLVEEITTRVYVAAHSDLDSQESESEQDEEEEGDDDSDDDSDDDATDVSAHNSSGDVNQGGYHAQRVSWAPVREKSERERLWNWTLEPLDEDNRDNDLQNQKRPTSIVKI